MQCQKCGNTDLFEYDERINMQEEYAELRVQCNDCGVRYKVDLTIVIDNVEELEDAGV